MNARKSLLFYNDAFWVKKQGNELFDVAMGSYDGAEVADLVGLFILHTLGREIKDLDIGLYRDDGLGVVHKANGHTMDNLKSLQSLQIYLSSCQCSWCVRSLAEAPLYLTSCAQHTFTCLHFKQTQNNTHWRKTLSL